MNARHPIAPTRPKPRPMPRPRPSPRLGDLDELVSESRPPGSPFDGADWDLHFARAERIESSPDPDDEP